jgi:hypothetical protein
MRSMLIVAIAMFAVGLGACRADRDAAEPIDMSPDPRIEAAPAYPTPPGEVPIGLQPDTGPQPTVDLDTLPRGVDTEVGPGGAGALPARP